LIGHALIAVSSVGLEISKTTFQFRITNICTNLISILGRAIVNKGDLIETLRSETGLSRSKAEAVVELFFDEMSKALANDDRVEIRDLCSIHVKEYKGYIGRNPKTGRSIQVPSKQLPFFKCGKELKERVDYEQAVA
jgi:integration host factor subunit beta